MARKGRNEIKVGLLVLSALAVLAVGILLIGQQSNLFRATNEYYVEYNNVAGLTPGNPVQLNGVDVGRVSSVVLPEEPGEMDIRVWLSVDRRYAPRIRQDSEARIKTLGLLGDKFIEIVSGSPEFPPIPDGGQIPTRAGTSLDELMASGEDLMDNVMSISSSLRTVLARMEGGEGILGQLTMDTPEGEQLVGSLVASAESVERLTATLETGDGPLPRLLHDKVLAQRLDTSMARLESVLAKVDEGEGALPMLINDPAGAERVRTTLANLEKTSADLSALVEDVRSADGLLQRLLLDEQYADDVAGDIEQVVDRVDRLSVEISEGEGTVAQLIRDPSVYQSINDILIGINESRVLRWLIRNRQSAGIERRYEDAVEAGEIPPLPPGGEEDEAPVPTAEEPPPLERPPADPEPLDPEPLDEKAAEDVEEAEATEPTSPPPAAPTPPAEPAAR
ncbi:MAG TPA: MlaD family protein [Thermoanaerobaculia bacterium]|nr:MlaD family protein [Thermoanaerobaculia bacterium]